MNIDPEDEDEPNGNLTPLIDVVFLLLIFFMVTTTFLDPEREIDIDLPVAESGGEPLEELEEIVVSVTEEGEILYSGRSLGREELISLLKGAAQHDPSTPVTIRGHRLARHEAIVTVMDACGVAGISNLAVGTTVEDEG